MKNRNKLVYAIHLLFTNAQHTKTYTAPNEWNKKKTLFDNKTMKKTVRRVIHGKYLKFEIYKKKTRQGLPNRSVSKTTK